MPKTPVLDKGEEVNSLMNGTVSPVAKDPTLQKNVEKAQTFLNTQLSNLTQEDLNKLGISSEKRDKLLEFINNIDYSAATMGTAYTDIDHIVVSNSCTNSDNLADMITLLMHEANHCYNIYDSEQNSSLHIDTKSEEKECETLGLMTSAILIDKGELKGYENYGRYGNGNPMEPNFVPHPVTEYLNNKEMLYEDIDNWLRTNYTNLPDNTNGDLTVEHTWIGNNGEILHTPDDSSVDT